MNPFVMTLIDRVVDSDVIAYVLESLSLRESL